MSLRPRRWLPLAVAFIALIFFVDHVLISRAAPAQQVWINEFLPKPSTGNPEWVELFNPNPAAIDISGWKIDDNTIGGTQIIIPAGTFIPSNSLFVMNRSGNIFDDTDGVQLLRTDNSVADAYFYASTTIDLSYARIPDGSSTWQQGSPSKGAWNVGVPPTVLPTDTSTPTNTSTATNAPTATPTDTPTPTDTATPTNTPTPTSTPTMAPTATPYPTGIILNEFLANPTSGQEWIELYNSGGADADLSGWKLDDGAGGSAPYTLPMTATIAVGGYLVLYLPSTILNNSGDTVQLIQPDGIVIDSTTYTGSTP
ncbi:MAG TPA: lamin tail domain-containing protein, partial [Roseiflexaceae bacterium]